MKHYEILLIIKNNLTDTEADKHFSNAISDIFKEHKATITFSDFWGSRGFAYTIKAMKWGYYGHIQFDADSEAIQAIHHDLSLDTNVLRFLITTVDDNAAKPRKYSDKRKEWLILDEEKNNKKLLSGHIEVSPSLIDSAISL